MNIIEMRDAVMARTSERIAAIQQQIEADRKVALRPEQTDLRAEFDQAAQTLEGMDAFQFKYGNDEFLKQWKLRVKREGGTDG